MPQDNNHNTVSDTKPNNLASHVHHDVVGVSGVVTLDRPHVLNALNADMVWSLHEIFTRWKNDPAVGLFISFITLYKHAQDNVNSFTQRHLDFYYRDILKTQYKHKTPERVVLNFEISPRSDPVTIQKGSRFSCMKDEDSKDVIFEVNNELNVSDAKIREIHSLRFQREDMITPACDMNLVTRIYKQSLVDSTEEDIDNNFSGSS